MVEWEELQALSRAAESSPKDPDVWLRLAEALLNNGSADAARHMLVRARNCEPKSGEQWKKLGELGHRLEAQSELPIPAPAPAPSESVQDSEVTAPREVRPRRGSSISAEEVTFRGDLTHFTLPDILEFLSVQRSTGSLQLQSGTRFGVVQMARGRVVDVIYPKRPTLLSMLTATRRLSAVELSRVPQAALTDETAFRESLVQLGLVDADVLSRVVWQRIEDGLQELLRWTNGQAEFRVDRSAGDAEPDGIDTRYLLLSVLKSQDEAGRHPLVN